jgi:hypothetical protein
MDGTWDARFESTRKIGRFAAFATEFLGGSLDTNFTNFHEFKNRLDRITELTQWGDFS